ncbi:cell shape-determining protein MreC [Clostridiales bacterium]|nr:cell shape-determining protein MreC [Clostridiales bacterium]
MKFFNEYKRQVITLIVIVLAIISVFTAGRKINAAFIDDALGFVVTPFQGIVSSVGKWTSDSVSNLLHRNELSSENKELKSRIEELEAENARLSLYEDENKRLSELLEVAQRYKEYNTTGAAVIAKDTGVWYDSFLINKGTMDGIEDDMAVVNAGGLVGRISKASASYSNVYSILDSRSSVSAKSLRTGDLGVIVSDHELMERGLCKMEYIDSEAEIMEGDEIITSGLSEVYPAGLSIGYVREIHQDENGLTKYAIVEPKVDFKHIDTVLVVTDSVSAAAEGE